MGCYDQYRGSSVIYTCIPPHLLFLPLPADFVLHATTLYLPFCDSLCLGHTCYPLGLNGPFLLMHKHFLFVSISQIRHHLCPNRVEFIMLLALWLTNIISLCKVFFGLFYYFPLLSLSHIHFLTVPAQAPSLVDYSFNSWTIHSVLVHECIINVHEWYCIEI